MTGLEEAREDAEAAAPPEEPLGRGPPPPLTARLWATLTPSVCMPDGGGAEGVVDEVTVAALTAADRRLC